jgi:hypothetical protein
MWKRRTREGRTWETPVERNSLDDASRSVSKKWADTGVEYFTYGIHMDMDTLGEWE